MSTSETDPRLRRLLGGPELASVRGRLRRHFERLDRREAPAFLRVGDLAPDAHAALCQLAGKPSRPARSMTLDIASLDASLRAAGVADSLRDALERLEGPIIPKASLRRDLLARWSALHAATGRYCPSLSAWLAQPVSAALLKRLGRNPERAASLLADADAVLRRLPVDGLPRSQLAAETLGDAHALDAGRPVASLVLAVWRHHERSRMPDVETAEAAAGDGNGGEERLREIWARAGVLVNELARPALMLNLPCDPAFPATWMPGEPAYLSLRQLLRQAPAWPVAGRDIRICENPNIVAIAADTLGADCAPLVCTDGMPAAAQRTLLDQLAAAGARLLYHGDYDWPGITIGNFIMRTWKATPWRFSTADYLSAVAQAPGRSRNLPDAGVDAFWDAGLCGAMREHGLMVAEEAVAGVMVGDLG